MANQRRAAVALVAAALIATIAPAASATRGPDRPPTSPTSASPTSASPTTASPTSAPPQPSTSTSTTAPTSSTTGHTGPRTHVALGDSWAAGSAVTPLEGPFLCFRSSLNYAHVMSTAMKTHLTDVSCGAAETQHMTAPQQPAGVAPQFDALTPDTELVTVLIGGNDQLTFLKSVIMCGLLSAMTWGQGNPCQQAMGTQFVDAIDQKTYPAVKATYEGIKARAPKAKVAAFSYMTIFPADGSTCQQAMPLALGDWPFMAEVHKHLNDRLKQAAAETGTTFIDMTAVSQGHDVCQKDPAKRWVEPVNGGTNIAFVHPSAYGEAAMAAEAMKVLGYGK